MLTACASVTRVVMVCIMALYIVNVIYADILHIGHDVIVFTLNVLSYILQQSQIPPGKVYLLRTFLALIIM